ncbi:hypothetical protein MLD38_037362 [Melastoma candidum]|uniref:Uncharacterized protein n=1 Tax=Melastoma candidum TaxID=119954 RepID=A0ACB9LMF6_9MYRT|nr:hypothetical protein MLD38_037362 [Melastoma candidum]
MWVDSGVGEVLGAGDEVRGAAVVGEPRWESCLGARECRRDADVGCWSPEEGMNGSRLGAPSWLGLRRLGAPLWHCCRSRRAGGLEKGSGSGRSSRGEEAAVAGRCSKRGADGRHRRGRTRKRGTSLLSILGVSGPSRVNRSPC